MLSTFDDLISAVQDGARRKKDMVVDTRSVEFCDDARLEVEGGGKYDLNGLAHGQLATSIGVPKRFYDHMLHEHRDVWRYLVNELLHRSPKRRMLRAHDNVVRAVLSDSYRRLDHDLVMSALIPSLEELGQRDELVLDHAEITERKLYVRILFPRIGAKIKIDPTDHTRVREVIGGVIVSNSETGHGRWLVQQYVYTQMCMNGLIIPQHVLAKHHIGVRSELGELQQDTVEAELEALRLVTRDSISNALNRERFEEAFMSMESAREEKLASPVKDVEVLSNQIGLSSEESESVLDTLVKKYSADKYGFIGALTEVAQGVEYDRRVEMERDAGELLLGRPKRR